ncbi:hypothetical protein LBMAG43_15530 [Methylococcaceae bacterium]|jgi:hypothetical protein|nr:hypothetical protein [Methylococcales bacterium]GDX85511.1 hypothetical protein LBMAG43_15530 [Methylococcaceae bacterium]
MNRQTKAQEEIAVFEQSFERIQKAFRLKNDAKEIKAYLFEYDLADFLVWVQQPIIDVFGEIRTSLNLSNALLVLTLFSGSDDKNEFENDLFERFDDFDRIDNALKYIDIELL